MTTTIDLLPFCAEPGTMRYETDKPFVFDGKIFATDGAIPIALPSGESNTQARTPDVRSILAQIESVPAFVECEFDAPDCTICSNKLEIGETCSECKGTGYVDHDCDCDFCNETDEDCYQCDGTGGKKWCECYGLNVNICGVSIAIKYARLLNTLPNPKFSESKEAGGIAMLCFTFDGGVGAVMERTSK